MRKVKYSFLGNKLFILNDIAEIAQTLEKSDISKIDTENSTEYFPFLIANKNTIFEDENTIDNVEFVAIQLTEDTFNILSNNTLIDKMIKVQEIDETIKSISFENKDFNVKLLVDALDINIDANCFKLVFLSDEDLKDFNYLNECYTSEEDNYCNYKDCVINKITTGYTNLDVRSHSKYNSDVISIKLHLESVSEFLEQYK